MSVRRVSCPGCSAALNVPATMTLVKCSSCGTVWDVNDPSSAKVTAAAKKTAAAKASDDGGERKKRSKPAAKQKAQAAMFAVVGMLFVVLIIAGIAIAMLTGGDDSPTEEPVAEVAEAEAVYEKPPAYYRVVKLPESTRKEIYKSFRMAASSSVEKKVMIPKNSIAAKTLKSTMTGLVDREVEMLALQHRIKPDDVLQIVAEGNDKGWPPRKKQKQPAK